LPAVALAKAGDCALSSRRLWTREARGSTQEKSPSKIFRFGYGKVSNDKKVPDPVGSGIVVCKNDSLGNRDHFADATSFAHCQNFSVAGLSRPFRAAMPKEIGLGSGVSRTSFTRLPKL
jgi:hypothetical protein